MLIYRLFYRTLFKKLRFSTGVLASFAVSGLIILISKIIKFSPLDFFGLKYCLFFSFWRVWWGVVFVFVKIHFYF